MKTGSKYINIFTFILLSGIFLLLLNSVNNVYQKKKNAENALYRMENEITELEKRKNYLSSSLQRLSTEEGMKFEVKRKLNVAQVGERVAVIVEDQDTQKYIDKKPSFWANLLDWLRRVFN